MPLVAMPACGNQEYEKFSYQQYSVTFYVLAAEKIRQRF